MPVRTRLTPLAKTIQLVVDRNLSPKARSARVAAFAQDQIDAADAQNRAALGTVPPKTVTVDGRQGALLTSVNPDRGIIIAEWSLVGDVLQWIFATLRARSPIVSGDYLRGHMLFADGVECDPTNPPPAQEYIFLNVVPYARKIEIGVTEKGEPFVIQVENRIYQRTADDARSRFGNVVKIRSTYSSLSSVGATPIGKWASTASARALAARHKRRTNSTEWLTRVPAIVVTLQ
ncbi:hypothetical protein ACRQ5Q_16985 [Bradyrhizobium sp. PMVTL-01]|uniref:hypothetical protein n=1 Tax=Bradyrhizobium sp. PMVTL-01 TaxID=3434999 RepID=UPI003F7187E8